MTYQLNTLTSLFIIMLLGLWVILLFGGFAFGTLQADNHRIPKRNRMASSAVLVIIAWGIFLSQSNTSHQIYTLALAMGMSFGLLGDLFMAQLMPVKDYTRAGIVAFGLGHMLYIIGIVHSANINQLNDSAIRWGALLLWLVIGAMGWFVCVFWRNHHNILHLFALPYSLLLASIVGLFMGNMLQNASFTLPTIGAILFLVSDLTLSLELFRNFQPKGLGDVVWLTYGPGQMLIVCGIAITSLLA